MRGVLLALLLCASASAQSPQVPVTGNIGTGFVGPLISSPSVIFTSDANHIMAYPEVSGSSGVLVVTSSVSLTAARNMVAPLTKGFQWLVKNQTTGGQSIQVIGATGSGVTIANGASALVYCDGTNYLSPSSMVYPGTGVPNSTGSAWGTSYAVGSGANSLVQLNSSGALPAVNGANLTNLTGTTTINGTACPLNGSCTVGGTSIGGVLSNTNCSTGAGAGSGSSCTLAGYDGTHILTVTTGSSPTIPGALATVTFTTTRGHTSYCSYSPADVAAASTLSDSYMSANSATAYTLGINTTIAPGVVVSYNVSCP